MEEKFDDFVNNVTSRLDRIEHDVELNSRVRGTNRRSANLGSYGLGFDHQVDDTPNSGQYQLSGTTQFSDSATGIHTDIQGDFASLRDSLSRVKLPSDLRINDSRQGIQRSDQPIANIIAKCGRYAETSVKLLTTLKSGTELQQETLEQLFIVNQAQIKYLQDEYASILVNSQFDSSTSKLFRALQKNTSGLNAESLDTLRSAATLASAARPPSTQRQQQGSSGRGRGRYPGGRGQDVFSSFSQRNFPGRKQGNRSRDDNQGAEKDDQ